MCLLRPGWFRHLPKLGLTMALAASPAFGETPSSGVYTYRHGYNPGYYGSRTCPADPGAKLGQAIPGKHPLYQYVSRNPQPAQSSPKGQTRPNR
jgi:hypothetical protein